MAEVQHGTLRPGAASGNHVIHDWEVADAAARLALTTSELHVGRVCRQLSDSTWWILARFTGGVVWKRIDVDAIPPALSNAIPMPLGVAAPGMDNEASRGGHVHAHGDQGGGSLHPVATGLVAGFMSAVDKAKLDGVATGAGVPPAGPSAPPPNIAAASDIGAPGAYARELHTHGHGDQAGGTLHAPVAAGGAAGFMTGADKTKLDGIATGATVAPVSSVFSRVGAVVATLGDYTSSLITNLSGVTGATVTAALDALQTALSALSTTVSGKAPATPSYVTLAADATLPNERVLVRGAGIAITDGGAGGNVTIAQLSTLYGQAASYTLQATDAGNLVYLSSASPLTLTVPSAVIQAGNTVRVLQSGAGQITITPAGGVNLYSALGGGSVKTRAQYSVAILVWSSASDVWVYGDLEGLTTTGTPVAVGTANAPGSGTALALATHVHDHGAQPLGTGNQHAVATTTVAGFMSGADKAALIAAAPKNFTIVTFTGSLVLTAAHAGAILHFTGGSVATLTVPSDATENLPLGFTASVVHNGFAHLNVNDATAGSGLIDGYGCDHTIGMEYRCVATFVKLAADTWFVNGTFASAGGA